MNYALSVHQRLLLLNILPTEDHVTTMRLARELREACSFDEADHALLNMRQEGNRLLWNEGLPDKDVEIGPTAAQMIRDALKKLDDAGKIRDEHLLLVDLFEYEG